jgi:hypothetical protein
MVSFKDKDLVLHKDNYINKNDDNENFEIIRCIIED